MRGNRFPAQAPVGFYQRSVCRFKGASLHEFQVHVAVAGIGRKALGSAKILLDRGAAADGEAIVVGVGKGHATTACGQVQAILPRRGPVTVPTTLALVAVQ